MNDPKISLNISSDTVRYQGLEDGTDEVIFIVVIHTLHNLYMLLCLFF